MKPLITSHIDDMDRARMEFIDRLLAHVDKLREEMRINEVILHSVVQSLSSPSDEMQKLDYDLHKYRSENAHHKPMILTEEEQKRLDVMKLAMLDEVKTTNERNN